MKKYLLSLITFLSPLLLLAQETEEIDLLIETDLFGFLCE